MKKNKLYTVNQWNRPAFMPADVDRVHQNIFDGANTSYLTRGNAGMLSYNTDPTKFFGFKIGVTNPTQQAATSQYMQNQGNYQMDNPFSFKEAFGKDALKAGLKAGAGAAISAGAGIVGGLANSAISGGLESGAGSAISSVGSTIGGAVGAVNPLLGAAVGVGSQLVGGLVNRAFGTKVDQAKLKVANESMSKLNSFNGNVGSFDDIQGPEATASVAGTYKGGWFSGGKARRKQRELERQLREAKMFADRSITNNVANLNDDQLNNELANFSAFGGPLDIFGNSMDAINYGFMSDYLTQKKQQNDIKNKMAGITPISTFAFGGDMQSNGADWLSGLTHISAGGSHEESPYDGVQLGVDSQNIPNLVEEGETVYDDYVYSNRILADDATKQMFRLPKKKDITFAEISKKLEKEIAERPNDPLSEAGFKAQMLQLQEQQERQKQEMEAERAKAAFEALSPEKQTAIMQRAAQEEQMAQQVAQEQAIAEQQAMQQPSPEEVAMAEQQMADGSEAAIGQEPQVNCMGGKLFPWGGYTDMLAVTPPYQASNTAGFIPYDRKLTEDEVLKLEQEQRFKDWTDYVNSNWDTEEIQGYLKALDAAAGGNHLFDKDGELLDSAKEYFNHARTKNHKWGYYHLTPEQLAEKAAELTEVNPDAPRPSKKKDNPEGITTDPSGLKPDDSYVRKSGDDKTVKSPEVKKPEGEKKDLAPVRLKEWPRYAGLFGPAAGLGLMAAGVGKPDYSRLDAAASGAGNYTTANWMPIGDYKTYRPLDRLFKQNMLDAQARATDRAILNSGANQGSKMAGLIANGYNSQLASGNLFRQEQEYNDALDTQARTFNRDTNKFNADAFARNSQFNAAAYNEASRAATQAKLQAARERLDADAGWYNSLYGNIQGLFKGIGDLGKENAQNNMINWMISKGIFGAVDPTDSEMKKRIKVVSAKGGKINKKKGLTY